MSKITLKRVQTIIGYLFYYIYSYTRLEKLLMKMKKIILN